MTPEQKAAILARLEKGYYCEHDRERCWGADPDVRDLLAALDRCEQEREKAFIEASLARASYRQLHTDGKELSKRAERYAMEAVDLTTRLIAAEQQLTEARRLIVEWRDRAEVIPSDPAANAMEQCADDLAHTLQA